MKSNLLITNLTISLNSNKISRNLIIVKENNKKDKLQRKWKDISNTLIFKDKTKVDKLDEFLKIGLKARLQ